MNIKLLHSIITRLDTAITNLSTKKNISVDTMVQVLNRIKTELQQVDPDFRIEESKENHIVKEKHEVQKPIKGSILAERKGWE